jgi:hypothetical protein
MEASLNPFFTMQSEKQSLSRIRWNEYDIAWEEHIALRSSIIRLTGEHLITKDLFVVDLQVENIKQISNGFIEDKAMLFLLFRESFGGKDPATSVSCTTISSTLRLTFTHQTRFKAISFNLLLEKQLLDTNARLDQIAETTHRELGRLQDEVQKLHRENAFFSFASNRRASDSIYRGKRRAKKEPKSLR